MYLIWKMELLATNDLTSKCFDVINNQSMQFHSERFSGSLASQVSRFANAYERFINSTIMNILPLIISLGFYLVKKYLEKTGKTIEGAFADKYVDFKIIL